MRRIKRAWRRLMRWWAGVPLAPAVVVAPMGWSARLINKAGVSARVPAVQVDRSSMVVVLDKSPSRRRGLIVELFDHEGRAAGAFGNDGQWPLFIAPTPGPPPMTCRVLRLDDIGAPMPPPLPRALPRPPAKDTAPLLWPDKPGDWFMTSASGEKYRATAWAVPMFGTLSVAVEPHVPEFVLPKDRKLVPMVILPGLDFPGATFQRATSGGFR